MSQVKPESSGAVSGTATERAEHSVPEWVYPYKAGVIGGAFGGLAMVLVAALYGFWSGRGIWLPVNLIGATFVRDLQGASLETLAVFNLAALIVGMVLHGILSVGLGFVFSLLLPTMPGPPLIWALTVGPLLWVIATWLALPIINPVMADKLEWSSFFLAHLAYGLVMGGYVARQPKIHVD